MIAYEKILTFWFGQGFQANPFQIQKSWFQKSEEFDKTIREKFENDLEAAVQGQFNSWKENPRTCLAYVILLDQFSRNMYRDTPQAFAQDELALSATIHARKSGFEKALNLVERWFLYMPYEHAENLKAQEESVVLFQKLLDEAPEKHKSLFGEVHDYAVKHYEIIKKFGRFPHRNAILCRKNSKEEEEFLKKPGSSF